jgi:hypothetical protein
MPRAPVVNRREAAGLVVRSQTVWASSHFVQGRGNHRRQHEPRRCADRMSRPDAFLADRRGGDADAATIDRTQ